MTHTAIISLGSNIAQAAEMISRSLLGLSRCGLVSATDSYPSEGGYTNCVAELRTELVLDALRSFTKQIEQALGRRIDDKQQGKIVIDVDIVYFDGKLLRPADAHKSYFTMGLRLLKDVNSMVDHKKIL